MSSIILAYCTILFLFFCQQAQSATECNDQLSGVYKTDADTLKRDILIKMEQSPDQIIPFVTRASTVYGGGKYFNHLYNQAIELGLRSDAPNYVVSSVDYILRNPKLLSQLDIVISLEGDSSSVATFMHFRHHPKFGFHYGNDVGEEGILARKNTLKLVEPIGFEQLFFIFKPYVAPHYESDPSLVVLHELIHLADYLRLQEKLKQGLYFDPILSHTPQADYIAMNLNKLRFFMELRAYLGILSLDVRGSASSFENLEELISYMNDAYHISEIRMEFGYLIKNGILDVPAANQLISEFENYLEGQ